MNKISNPPELASHFIDASEMQWKETGIEKIMMKVLYKDGDGRSTIMFKMEPGAVVPLHEHTKIEQTYVLEGSLEDDEGVCSAGNFVWRPGGNIHIATAPKGAVILSVFMAPNRFMDGTAFYTNEKPDGSTRA